MKEIRQKHKLWNKEAKRPELGNKRLSERSRKLRLKIQREREEAEELSGRERLNDRDGS